MIFSLGFGDIVPDTDGGRIFVIIYSMIGIPLNIFVTATIGFLFSASLRNLINWTEGRLFPASSASHIELKLLVTLVVMCIAWLSIGARMTLTVMKWSWIEGFYAVFVKFSTIGYGDYTLDFEKVSTFWEILSWYTNIGLAIVAGIFDALTRLLEERKKDQNVSKDSKDADNDTVEMNIIAFSALSVE